MLDDVRMPVLDGIEATARITADAEAGNTKVLMLTTFDLDDYLYPALRAGASGFLLKDVAPEQLLDAIRVVAAGDALLAPAATRRLDSTSSPVVQRPTGPRRRSWPSSRNAKREVLELVGRGLTNDEIGHRLHMSPATARTHVGRTMTKLHARDRVQLVVIAYESGLVAPGEP